MTPTMWKFVLVVLSTAGACVLEERCNSNGYCAEVCKPGTVEVDSWTTQAFKIQNGLNHHQHPCAAQMLGSHNSAITLADGYGTENQQYAEIFEAMDLLPSHVILNNQNISVQDQLNAGVRLVEIDVHWVLGALRVAHCGGFGARVLDGAMEALAGLSGDLGLDIDWDLQTIGCEPSLSGLPAHDQKFFVDALREVRLWLDENPGEFVMLYLDNQQTIEDWGKLPLMLDTIDDVLADILWVPGGGEGETIGDILAEGKQVLVLSRTDYGEAMNQTMVNHRNFCGWKEPKADSITPSCAYVVEVSSSETIQDIVGKAEFTIRPTGDGIEYGPFNGAGQLHGDNSPMGAPTLEQWAACGGMPSPDFVTPELSKSFIWSVRGGEYIYNVSDAALSTSDGRWFKTGLRGYPKACRCGDYWEVADECGDYCEASAPRTGYENAQLWGVAASHHVAAVRLTGG